jgi:hypothetical protein
VKLGRRVVGALELTAFRLLAPRWFAQKPLDTLLAEQRRRPLEPAAGELRTLERDVARVEALLARARSLPGSCLYRALARYALLRRRGYDACFVLGVDARGLEQPGHAWVEVFTRPFAEHDDLSRYRVTFRYPARVNDGSLGQ